MTYITADIHGEYEMFCELLRKISFSESDIMYVCGDIIDKGSSSVKLARMLSKISNIHCIMGNHELAFLKYYDSLMEESPNDFDSVLDRLNDYFPDDEQMDWETVDWLDALPPYIETNDFICVHAGIPILQNGELAPFDKVSVEQLVYDRHFKEPSSVHTSKKCVFFGHTQTDVVCGEAKILAYKRRSSNGCFSIADLYKVHLDTGSWSNGVLGCFCVDNMKVCYVIKRT